jgi:hypothetical protein
MVHNVYRNIYYLNYKQITIFKVVLQLYIPCILGAFLKLQKATMNVIVAVGLFAWNNSAPNGRIFKKIRILVFFGNLMRKFKIH